MRWTTDGEFLVLTSQAPLPRPPVFVSQPLDKIPSLPRVLNEQGYHTASIHGFNGAFWHREIAHTALGYDEMLFKDDLDLTDHIGWGWSDKAVLRAAAEKVIASEKPLFLHVITLTNHHPYYYIAKEQGIEPGTIEEEFLRSVGYLDEAIEIFFDKLAEAGMLDDCLIVIYGDHDSAIDEQLEAHLDHTNPRLVTDTVPVVMVGFNRPATRVDVMAGLQDVPVMVLEELGLEAPLTFLGSGWNRWVDLTAHRTEDGRVLMARCCLGRCRSTRPCSLNWPLTIPKNYWNHEGAKDHRDGRRIARGCLDAERTDGFGLRGHRRFCGQISRGNLA